MPLSAIQPQRYEQLLREKVASVKTLLSPYPPHNIAVYPSPPIEFRMRAEFRIWHEGDDLDYVMFARDDPRTPVAVDDFVIAHGIIRAIMPRLKERLRGTPELRRKLFQAEFLCTLSGELLVTLVYHRKLGDDWTEQARLLREALQRDVSELFLIGRSRGQKVVEGRDYVREVLDVDGRRYGYRQYEQSFTQPNAEVNRHMIEWVCARAGETRGGDLLELYCGNGNFTLPLANHFDTVVATEVAKSSVRAAHANIAENGIDNIYIARLAAAEAAQALRGERTFRRLAELPRPLHEFDLRTLFVDPPRAGLDAQTLAMARDFDHVIYISCNPASLAANLAQLTRTHRVTACALFDQFPYTDHMECGVTLERIAS